MAREEFDALVEQAMAAGEYAHMRPVIEKELLHYDILHSLDRHRLLDPLVFQGGTCLRLIHGAPRFSEDLDFVGGTDFTTDDLHNLKECIEQDIGRRYGLEVIVKPPRALKEEPDNRDVRVEMWQISIITGPNGPGTCADNYPGLFTEKHFAKRLTASFRSTFRPAPWNETGSLSTWFGRLTV
ncbi:MAG: nucleotidyl transferase AbiEii/AbiGii toxin family protein [Xanthomonadaceae bacterium]|nr:nucleotidyl transferase AbiEii/AbiGii toxin family protein [Xanthomonadaceae bacterium]